MGDSLSTLFETQGIPHLVGGNQPFLLDDPAAVWFVRSGRVDLFSVKLEAGKPTGSRFHFFSVEAGQIMFGAQRESLMSGRGLLAVGMANTQLLRLDLAVFQSACGEARHVADGTRMIDAWVAGLGLGVSKDLNPRTDLLLEENTTLSITAQKRFRSKRGVMWLAGSAGDYLFLGMEDVSLGQDQCFPLSHETWLEVYALTQVQVIDTAQALQTGQCWTGLELLFQIVLKSEALNKRLAEVDEFNRLKERAENWDQAASVALDELRSVLDPVPIKPREEVRNPLFQACQIIARAQGMELQPPPELLKGLALADPLAAIGKASKIRIRKVALVKGWWQQESGALLAYLDGRPVALLQRADGAYEVHDPTVSAPRLLEADGRQQLDHHAYVFYRSFPDEVFNGWKLLRFGIRGLQRDFALLLTMGALGGLLGTLLPIGTALAFNHIVPDANRLQLWQLVIGLLAAALGAGAFQFVSSITLLRIEGKLDYGLQAAVIDRLLKLPVPFFRQYNSGDLAQRAMAIDQMRQLVSNTLAQTVLVSVFATFNLILLFYYDAKLALLAISIIAVVGAYSLRNSIIQVRLQRRIVEQEGKISGMVLQFLTGIPKLRVAGAEMLAFAAWAKRFALKKRLHFAARKNGNQLLVFNAVAPILALALLFGWVVYGRGSAPLNPGDFLAFILAFNVFFAAMLSMTSMVVSAATILPLYERIRPILETQPEVQNNKLNPGTLAGKIELSRVSFRYGKDTPLVLQDVSLQIQPGEFVAIVGPSGSGKSTLFRLLLGFENLESGSIQYDGQDLSELDVALVRRQIGVVLQTGKLMPGTILDNINGSLSFTVDEAWAAARLAGMAEDIEKMPMGISTVITAGSSLFSGGQQQRLMIARALVLKPRMLFLDEATSALDNRTQALVSQSLEGLQATRVIIAHRLSTVVKADRIFVLDGGRVVQSGTYDELIKQPGLFSELARRQTMDTFHE